MWMLRWYLFRIMMGAGLVKLKSDGDPKWKLNSVSAMECFYETQPVLNPLTRSFHWAPKWWHKVEVLSNHFVELIAPCLLLVPISQIRRSTGAATHSNDISSDFDFVGKSKFLELAD
jgi:hypothetical protein